jgi:hypothetical protein
MISTPQLFILIFLPEYGFEIRNKLILCYKTRYSRLSTTYKVQNQWYRNQQSQKFHIGILSPESYNTQEQMQPPHQGAAARLPKYTE